jgi:hypothetical protein
MVNGLHGSLRLAANDAAMSASDYMALAACLKKMITLKIKAVECMRVTQNCFRKLLGRSK